MREAENIRRKYCPELFEWLGEVSDPRHQSYITYGMKEILGVVYYKGLMGLESMRSVNESFEDLAATKNIYHYLGEEIKNFLPHHQTVNDLLCRIRSEEIEAIIQKIIYRFIRRKSFDHAKFQKKWLVIIDGTELYSGRRRINEHCLKRRYKKGTIEEHVNYYCAVVEAKIYLGNNIVASIGSEFIENNSKNHKRQAKLSEESVKQDCEINAFKRLAAKLKKAFPRLPICILGDSLYACEPVMDICKENHWDYILRYKGGSIPSIEEEYENILEKIKSGQAEYVNNIGYRKHEVNMLRYRVRENAKTETLFQFLSNIQIKPQNAEKIGETGRQRWKIENHGFKRQKQEVGNITHVSCWNAQAMKNHYLLQQIADLFRKLYEHFYLEKLGIIKTQKKISSDFLHSIYQPLTGIEDTFQSKHKAKPLTLY